MDQELHGQRKRHLAEVVALAFGIVACAAHADPVTSCLDDGSPGTLRVAMGAGGFVDASQLSCSTITLTQGEIVVPYNTTLQGHDGLPHIVAAPNSRVLRQPIGGYGFYHRTLTVSDVTISGGRVYMADFASGGCIFGEDVTLVDSRLDDCVVASAGAAASGGAIAALDVTLTRSKVENSAAYAAGRNWLARGGGVYAPSAVDCTDSTISGNHVSSEKGGSGGGIFVGYNLSLLGCTVDHNSADYGGGILQLVGRTYRIDIRNSTISSNVATRKDGGLVAAAPFTLIDSTVAFNQSLGSCAGVRGSAQVTLQGTIIANNRSASSDCVDFYSPLPAIGANNLITFANSPAPADTLAADPKLTPLADHGGPTLTHGLSLSSPAIDHGAAASPLPFDQRDQGFDRVVGVAADIGAFERQADDDAIFFGGFE